MDSKLLLIATPGQLRHSVGFDRLHAVTSQHLLYFPPTGNGRGANTLLACFKEACRFFIEQSATSFLRFTPDSNRRRWIAMVHLEVFFRGARDNIAN